MIIHTPLVADNLPIKSLVATQQPTNNIITAYVYYIYVCMHVISKPVCTVVV